MAGNFTPGVSKKQPGAYFNFESEAKRIPGLSERGIIILPLMNAKYGPLKKFFLVENTDLDGQFDKLGYKVLADEELLAIREAVKKASKIWCYIPGNAGTKAQAVINPLTVTAKHVGTRGNDFRVVIADSVISNKKIEIYLGTSKVFEQDKVDTVENLNENDFVDFTGSGALADTAGNNFTGGVDATFANSDYTDMLNEMETLEFNAAAFDVTDPSLLTAINTKFKYFRGVIGKDVVAVTANNKANHEAIISTFNGVVLADRTLTPQQATYFVAGATAAAAVNESLTDIVYDDSIDVLPRLTYAQRDQAIDEGYFVFKAENGTAKVVTDINTLTVLTKDKDKSYKKNRVQRVLGAIMVSGSEVLKPNFFDNDPDGHFAVKQDFGNFLLRLQQLRALKNVDVKTDIIIDEKLSIGDEAYLTVHVQPVDSIEKYYVTVKTS